MRKIKHPKIGEYVLVTMWVDKDPHDPWYVSHINEVYETHLGFRYCVNGSKRNWKFVFRITKEEGEEWLKLFGNGKT